MLLQANLQGEDTWKVRSDRYLKKKKAVMNFKHASAGKSALLIHTISMQAKEHSPVFLSSAHTTRGLWLGGEKWTTNYEMLSMKKLERLGFVQINFYFFFKHKKNNKKELFWRSSTGRPAVSGTHIPPLSLKRKAMISNTFLCTARCEKPYSLEPHLKGHFNFIYYFHTSELPNRQTTQRESSGL